MATVYTIGHSSHEWAQFAALLGASKITALADARSSPSSRYPHFSRSALKARLNACGIAYLFLGVELGGRPPVRRAIVPATGLRAERPFGAPNSVF